MTVLNCSMISLLENMSMLGSFLFQFVNVPLVALFVQRCSRVDVRWLLIDWRRLWLIVRRLPRLPILRNVEQRDSPLALVPEPFRVARETEATHRFQIFHRWIARRE